MFSHIPKHFCPYWMIVVPAAKNNIYVAFQNQLLAVGKKFAKIIEGGIQANDVRMGIPESKMSPGSLHSLWLRTVIQFKITAWTKPSQKPKGESFDPRFGGMRMNIMMYQPSANSSQFRVCRCIIVYPNNYDQDIFLIISYIRCFILPN